MQKCSYCGFVTKYNLNHCPSCGATQYTKIDSFDNYEINDCSKLKLKCMEAYKFNHNAFYYLGCLLLCFIPLIVLFLSYKHVNVLDIDFTKIEAYYLAKVYSVAVYVIIMFCSFIKPIVIRKVNILFYVAIFSPVIFLSFIDGRYLADSLLYIFIHMFSFVVLPIFGISGLKEFIDNYKKQKMVERGYLIKNVKYELINDSNNPFYKRIKVNYISKDGFRLELVSSQCINYIPTDNTVDILIDRNDLNNYYIDFEIL